MTILEFLQMGGKMVFPSGYVLKGDPVDNYIDTGFTLDGFYVGDGLRILNKDGLRLALKDEKKYRKIKNHDS